MDPITDLRLAAQHRATLEHRAAEERFARSIRPRRTRRTPSVRPRNAVTTATPLACCAA